MRFATALAAAVSLVSLIGCGHIAPSAPAADVPRAGVAARVDLTATPRAGEQGGTASINATVLDFAAAPVSNQLVTFTATAGTVAEPAVVTGADGVAQTTMTAPEGVVTVIATAGGLEARTVVIIQPPLVPPPPDAGAPSTQPPTSPPAAPSPVALPLPLVLSGQSNALMDHLGQPLSSVYAPGAVTVVARGSTPIRAWDVGAPMWQQLAPSLDRPLQAFVWWQGESDAMEGSTHYGADLKAFLGRVRAANGDPRLLVVLVKILSYAATPPLPDASLVRLAQETYVATDPDSVLIRVDDLPTDGGYHSRAYPQVADRILRAIQSRRGAR